VLRVGDFFTNKKLLSGDLEEHKMLLLDPRLMVVLLYARIMAIEVVAVNGKVTRKEIGRGGMKRHWLSNSTTMMSTCTPYKKTMKKQIKK
jgi:hypothetical protein